ncbi:MULTISPECIES: zinc-binding dehydrogenase [Rhizobium]|uniref:zinc-dependent alcohol dehydrogenase n=1 Tax=Rhizobium TaxID=379 RepID=UPI00195812AA|nr:MULTISPECIES: alcohol dehydrogenase catalytic domain-containing protein [Rhizobium]MBM7044786.1 alcohol dehydrogenase catalytic domain-containing protein [Rhizobium lusitanum]
MSVPIAREDQMLAIVKAGPGSDNVHLQAVEEPQAASGLARIKVIATGICGTDIHIARDEYPYEAPVVMGHEVLGVIDAVGDGKDIDLVGKRVVCETYFSTCGSCDWCRSGRRNLCPTRRSIGSFENGGFARYVVVPIINLHLVSDAVSDSEAVLAEPLACVTQALLDPPIVSAGDRVLVTGPGSIGQLASQVAMAQGGIVTLAGLEKDADRLTLAHSLGISTITSIPEANLFDVVIECSGSAQAAEAALRAARRGAHYIQIGIFGKDVTIPLDLVLYKELLVSSGFASTPTSWRRAMALIEQKLVNLEPLITRRVPIDKWQEGFDAAAKGEGLKTIILPA